MSIPSMLKNDPRLIAILLSLLISIFILNTNNPPLQIDGVLYMHTARAFLQGGWQAAWAAFDWPFYPMLIACVAKVLHLSLEHAAHCIDVTGIALLVFSFVTLIRQLNASPRVQWFAALIILTFPDINILQKTPVLRDFMYWGLLFLSLSLFVHFLKTQRFFHVFLFYIVAMLACLLRIEGVFTAYLLPLIIVSFSLYSIKHRCLLLLKSYIIPIIILLILMFSMSLHPHSPNRINYLIDLSREFSLRYQQATLVIENHLLSSAEVRTYLAAQSIFLFGFFGVIFMTCLKLSAYLYGFMDIHAMCKGLMPKMLYIRRTLYFFILIQWIICSGFIYSHFFVADRYLNGLVIGALLFAPFSLEQLYVRFKHKHYKTILYPVVMILIIILAVHGLNRSHYSKAYITEAGKWIATHTPLSSSVYSNDKVILYYSNHEGYYADHETLKYAIQKSNSYNIIVLRLSANDTNTLAQFVALYQQPIKTFKDSRDQVIFIFANTHKKDN